MELVSFKYSQDGKIEVWYKGVIVCKQNNMLQASKAFYKYIKGQE